MTRVLLYLYNIHEFKIRIEFKVFFVFKQKTAYEMRISDWSSECALPICRALADVAVAGDHRHLAREHHVGGAADAVGQALTAAVEVVELRLGDAVVDVDRRSEEHTSELQSLMRISYAVFCLKKKTQTTQKCLKI